MVWKNKHSAKTFLRGFCTPNHKLGWGDERRPFGVVRTNVTNLVPIADKLLRNLKELLNFLGHCGDTKWGMRTENEGRVRATWKLLVET